MTHFDWISALTGGALIGLSASLLMLLLGRIAGITGILAGVFGVDAADRPVDGALDDRPADGASDRAWRIAFIVGLVIVPLIAGAAGFNVAPPQMPASWTLTAVAGLLVGFGTRLGNGCTSGHGVCGIARLSPRSLVATAVFVVTAVIVVAVTHHVIGG